MRYTKMLISQIKVMWLKRSTRAMSTNVTNSSQKCTSATISEVKLDKTQRTDWGRVVAEAQKLVDYPSSSQPSLNWRFVDEVTNVSMHLRKFTNVDHPLLKRAKNAASQIICFTAKNRNRLNFERYNMQGWDLIVLLISKVAGQAPKTPEIETDKRAGIVYKQRLLAEACEMIRISHLVHQSLVNLRPLIKAGQDLALHGDMTFGNKVALLSGDYLMTCSSVQMAKLRDQDLYEILSSALRDLTEAEFIGDRDEQNNPLPSQPPKSPKRIASDVLEEYDLYLADDVLKPMEKERFMGNPETEWALRNVLCAGSLLGKSCLGALKLAGLPESTQKLGFHFGKHLVLAWQACLDLEPFVQPKSTEEITFSLVSAPVLFHLEYDPNAYELIKKGYVSVENVDYKTLHSEILKGPGVEKTQNLQRKHSMAAMKVLKKFPPSNARTALENILHAMQDL